MRTDGSGERLLTENFYQEAPSWSPNGRVLIFYRETKTDEKEMVFPQNYGQLTLQVIMSVWLKLQLTVQTHHGHHY